jgi:hypothetical protein
MIESSPTQPDNTIQLNSTSPYIGNDEITFTPTRASKPIKAYRYVLHRDKFEETSFQARHQIQYNIGFVKNMKNKMVRVIATQDIKANTTILFEQPMLVVLDNSYFVSDFDTCQTSKDIFDLITFRECQRLITAEVDLKLEQLNDLFPRLDDPSLNESIDYVRKKFDKMYRPDYVTRLVRMIFRMQRNAFHNGRIGLLYHIAHFFNHSCEANCEFELREDSAITIKTVKSVKMGEELCINYSQGRETEEVDDLLWSVVEDATISDRLGFECECKRCYVK